MQCSDLLIWMCTVLKILLYKKITLKKSIIFYKFIKHADLTLTLFVVDVVGLCYVTSNGMAYEWIFLWSKDISEKLRKMVVSANEAGKSYKTIATKKTKTIINLLSNVWEHFQHKSYSDQRPAKNNYKDKLYKASGGLSFQEILFTCCM